MLFAEGKISKPAHSNLFSLAIMSKLQQGGFSDKAFFGAKRIQFIQNNAKKENVDELVFLDLGTTSMDPSNELLNTNLYFLFVFEKDNFQYTSNFETYCIYQNP